ncbi:threonine ammonia-lyase [Leekyejoonella antrihumi]|uniref:Threonine/serine dehydratase n=1 Tax=Leekyejoonella antrihumi TaxID=1660198 RepID=A0A563E358_9MICO|nr:threonine/serine dehydratase [Leekyejoonella antrihumi]TWP36845.1 threonine/serine dehydratase [Leekyejoonella antrihumi]
MPHSLPMPDLDSIRAAQVRIKDYVQRTRAIRSAALSSRSGADVHLKLEIEQPTGSFKVRGACNAMRAMFEAGRVEGVTTASTGNHARAVTYLGDRFGLPVRAFLADSVAGSRVQALEELGATVDRSSSDQTAAIIAAVEYAEAHGYGFIPPFDHPDVISGQGTIGLELCDDLQSLDAVIVQVSGGGLIDGIALAVKAMSPSTRIIGVCADAAPAMKESLAAGHPVGVPELPTIAASLMGDLGPDNQYTFPIAQQVIDEMVAVSDECIRQATDTIADDEGLVVEPAAAAGAAYLRASGDRFAGARVALILTGNTVDSD